MVCKMRTLACVLCDQASETMDHIILGCVISQEVLARILKRLGLADLLNDQEEDRSSGGCAQENGSLSRLDEARL
jgi:hypothetical protein